MNKKKGNGKKLPDVIVDAIFEKKGENVIKLDLEKIENAVCNTFIICEADSVIQVGAIADAVVRKVRNEAGERPWHVEGRGNADWILIDYVNIVIHVFLSRTREFYKLEELWADAEKTELKDTVHGALIKRA